ncbi:hypothetical protein NM208_g6436 [Fusarium decemcellulare]|uniref:Uncharacterized protein n=1 Tax=Fusarium decemcellulare TaxID=57161 RepID=A0ACC1SCY8_9HYPO|nr:hypothetical protein NM208_g6436 [Fusarium decemcellulare]
MLDDRTNSEVPGDFKLWDAEDNLTAWTAYLGTSPGGDDVPVFAAPGRIKDAAGLPPLYLDTSQFDLFVAENLSYVQRFIAAGVESECHLYPGLPHGILELIQQATECGIISVACGLNMQRCRNCRIRKIRCNKEIPCFNCITSKITCQESTKHVTRRSTNPKRVPDKDPESIESLRKRVATLEDRLNALSPSRDAEALDIPTSASAAQSTTQQSPCSVDLTSLEGDSSFRKQALLATDITEFGSLAAIGSPQVVEKISGLRRLLQGKASDEDASQPRVREEPASIALQRNMPPSDFVIRLLRAARDSDCILTLVFPIVHLEQVEDLCRQVYFPVQTISIGQVTLLSAMLSVILTDLKHYPRPGFSDEEVEKYRAACRENWFTGIETYEVNMVATFEHCLALDAQTEGDLALQWRHSSTAARHCLVLGYNREHVLVSMPPEEADRVRRLFWRVYFSDKSTVLSLGRASTIQDVDVDAEPFAISSDPGREPWDATLFMFIDYVKIQAQIYEDLYSPASRRRNTGDKQAIVDNLSERLADWHQSWSQLDSSRAHGKRVFDSMFGPADVSYYSTLTLLHHALNPSASTNIISESCFEAAKKGLRSYMSVYAQYSLLEPESLAFFAVWVHVYSSLTPFVVTFLHCITNSDMNDLDLLKSSLDIMEQTSGLAKSCKRPYEFCKYLYGIADAYISASPGEVGEKGSSGLSHLQQPMNESWPFPELNFPDKDEAYLVGVAQDFPAVLDAYSPPPASRNAPAAVPIGGAHADSAVGG